MNLAAEERALFLLARLPKQFDEAMAASPSSLAALLPDCDPARLVQLATEHLVHPLVAYNLKRSGVEFEIEELQQRYRASHRNGLLLAHTLLDVLGDFDEAGIGVVCFKGPVFATTYYGDLRLRAYGDLDLFVSVADAPRARNLLLELGFSQLDELPRLSSDPADVRRRSYWPFGFPHGNAVGFVRDGGTDTQVDIDLQWAAAPNFLKAWIDPADLLARTQTVALFDHGVRAFEPADTLILMCLHGAKHAWTELRQVADVAACLAVADQAAEFNWEDLLGRIKEAKLVRVCALAIRLAESLLGAPVPARYRDRLLNESEGGAMESLVLQVLAWRFGRSAPKTGTRWLGAIRYHLASRDKVYHGFGSVVYHIRHALR